MVQESYKISPISLAYYRNKNKLSQLELADKANVCHRQYQRIEKSGQTTQQKAKSLAKALCITLDDLVLEKFESEWFVITPDGRKEINKYLSQFLIDIKEKANTGMSVYGNDLKTELHIDNDSVVFKTITVRFPYDHVDHVWTFYPFSFTNETGLYCHKFTTLLEHIWDEFVKSLMADTSSSIFINGQSLISLEEKVYFCVEFFKFDSKNSTGETHLGYQLFENHYQLACSFNSWLNDGGIRYFDGAITSIEKGKIRIDYTMEDNSGLYSLIVSRVWLDDNGKKRQVPWPLYHRNILIESMNKQRCNKDTCYSHVAVAPMVRDFVRPSDDYHIPEMSPMVSSA